MEKTNIKSILEVNSVWKYESESERAKILNQCAINGFKKLPSNDPLNNLNAIIVIDDETIQEININAHPIKNFNINAVSDL